VQEQHDAGSSVGEASLPALRFRRPRPRRRSLHCPVTGATLRIPFPLAPLARRPLLGSGHGWLVTADEASNLHLLNPVTGDQVALPPITALHHVEKGRDEQGDPAYLVYENLCGEYNPSKRRCEINTKPTILEVDQAYDYMYYRVAISASPSAERACVVLLLHMPHGRSRSPGSATSVVLGSRRRTPRASHGGSSTSTSCTVTSMACSMCLDLMPPHLQLGPSWSNSRGHQGPSRRAQIGQPHQVPCADTPR
jgi:hypothetical protein